MGIRRAPRGEDQIQDAAVAKIIAGTTQVGTAVVAGLADKITKVNSDGVTTAKLTANIGDPAGLADGRIYVVKDTADSNKIKLVVVVGGAFYIGSALTAAV